MEQISKTINTMMNKSKALELSCDKCGEKLYIEIEILGSKRLMPRMCKCQREEYELLKQQQSNKEKQQQLERLMNNSLMDNTFYERKFSNWDFNKGSRKMYNLGIKYSEMFKELKKEGIGLLIYGPPGNGKTFLTCCIANKLLENLTPTICVSINGLLSRIKDTYNKWGDEGEADILRGLNKADLLIIDDLGTEKQSEWSKIMVYNIIDSRYRSKLPLIITTNLDIDPNKVNGILADLYGRRTEDRILEMCTPVKNSGKSIRLQEAKRKTNIINSLLSEES